MRAATPLLAAVAGAVAAALAAAPAYAAGGATMTLSATHGDGHAAVTASFRIDRGKAPCGLDQAVVRWDQHGVGASAFHDNAAGDACVAEVTFTPPAGANGAGPHTVSGLVGPDGTSAGEQTYTVLAAPAPTTAAPKPTRPARSPKPARTTPPADQPADQATDNVPAQVDAGAGTPAVPGGVLTLAPAPPAVSATPVAAAAPIDRRPGTPWAPVAFGVALFLGGAALLVGMLVRQRRLRHAGIAAP